jgi:PPM family protein phosphatase
MTIRYGAATDRGRMREGNEDNFLSRGHLHAVADGMGGHQGGEVASRIAVEILSQIDDRGPWHDARLAVDALRTSIKQANRKIRETAGRDELLKGMGTTLTVVLEDGETFYLAHIGDSRAYLLRDGKLSLLTHDHTLVQQLVDEGRLTPEEAAHHPQRSIITRALGVDPDVEPDTEVYRRRVGDRLLLCTDGLSGVVGEGEIVRLLSQVRDPQECAEELVSSANAEGGPDNITVVVIDTDDPTGRRGLASNTGELRGPRSTDSLGPSGQQASMTMVASPTTSEASRDGHWADALAARMDPTRGRAGRRAQRTRARQVWRRILALVGVVAVLGAVAFSVRAFVYSRWWVGFDGDVVAVYQGVPGDVAGLRLSRVVERTGVRRDQVPDNWVQRLDDGVTRDSKDEATLLATCAQFVNDLTNCPANGGSGTPAGPTPTTRAPASTTTTKPA